mgnify:CR=1 FL=1
MKYKKQNNLYANFLKEEAKKGDVLDVLERVPKKKSGYSKLRPNQRYSPSCRHYPRLQKEGCFAALDVHEKLLVDKFSNEFNYDIIHNHILNINGFRVLSYADQIALSILGNQINDRGFYFKNLTLKSAYDVYLMSKKQMQKMLFRNSIN